ncbi:MAG: hypothetical protein BWY39_00712 [Spirochaetes bacterium ADurb.Bin269]|nr:MAG: hypothetical protein BWY39_00712 [Spirochaetes bacterium ADurb.Bin269]
MRILRKSERNTSVAALLQLQGIAAAAFLFTGTALLQAQTPAQTQVQAQGQVRTPVQGLVRTPVQTQRTVSAPVWVFLETVPGSEIKREQPPLRELEEIGRYLVGGMIFGWHYTYTPPDARRNVGEFFDLVPIQSIPPNDPHFYLAEIAAEYPRLSSWARYDLQNDTAHWQNRWDSVVFRTSAGRGTGERTDETGGILTAYRNALLQAVRAHARKEEKNKPKEIRGELLLRENPRMFTEGGLFVAEVRVRLSITETVPYRTF